MAATIGCVDAAGLVVCNQDGTGSSLVAAGPLTKWTLPRCRDAILADIDARLLDAERSEVAAVDASGGDYREDTGPRALLGVVGPAPRTE